MNARALANALLEADEDYVGDPMQYAFDTEKKDIWLVPKAHPWVHALRGLGFKLKHNEYTPRGGKHTEYWSAERDVEMKSGELLHITASGYDQPEMQGQVGVGINIPREGNSSNSIYSTRPLKPDEVVAVVGDILKILQRTVRKYDYNSYTRGLQETVNRVLKKYEYWENERD